MTTTPPPVAYSYVRFSKPEQADGDSLRRQTDGRVEDFCRRHGLTLDTTVSLRDLGVSAFRGKHRSDKHDLGKFLELVRRGRILPGSYLIVENLDRLSREEERAALRLWMDLLDAGVNIVQLEPETIFRHEKSDMMDIMRAIIELSRGHGESARKSDLLGKAWVAKRARARAGEEVVTRQVPAWVEWADGELRLIPERAAVVKRIFTMAASYGIAGTVKRLTGEGVPAFGESVVRPGRKRAAYSGVWVRAYVAKILKDRRALGEYQPRRGRKPEGDPVPGYFPAVVTEAEFLAARAGAEQRRRMPGRVAHHVNVFASLVKNARDGDTYFATTNRARGVRVMVNTAGAEGRSRQWSFPADTFEWAVLSRLAEIDPQEILNGDHAPDEALTLAGELAGVEGRIAGLEAELAEGDIPSLARALRSLEARRKDLAERLAAARQKAANPLSEAWGETQSLAAALEAAPDPEDARLRLRAALRRVVDSVWVLVTGTQRDRVCAAQVWFAGGQRCRSYLIAHRQPHGNASAKRPGGRWVYDLADVAKPDDLDLRKRDHARRLEKVLAAFDLGG
jgi:DNA invertase Pin-like site-specific DNA recombinase